MSDIQLLPRIEAVLDETRQRRHHLHRTPELALNENKTARYIRETLSSTQIKLLPPFIGTDVVGLLNTDRAGPNITLRADIDALPLQEKTGKPYASQTDGKMHACGHDGHTAILLAAALVLDQIAHLLPGSVRFVFQPGEEVVAAGRDLVNSGALLNPEPDLILALHGHPGFPAGHIVGMPGPIMAAAPMFRITVHGRGAHGSQPQHAVDPVLTASRIVTGLQSLVSRRCNPRDPVVVSVCRFESGFNSNIIPDTALLEGTTRFYNPEYDEVLERWLRETVAAECRAAGADYEVEYHRPYPVTINHDNAVELARQVTDRYLPAGFWHDNEEPSMGAEDFAYYLRKYPGAMLWLGMGEGSPALHAPDFDFNDNALTPGIALMAGAAIEFLTRTHHD